MDGGEMCLGAPCRDVGIQGCRHAGCRMQGCRVQGCGDSGMQDAGMWGFRDAGMQRCGDSRMQAAVLQGCRVQGRSLAVPAPSLLPVHPHGLQCELLALAVSPSGISGMILAGGSSSGETEAPQGGTG